jgi:hypothetical protein
MFAFKVEILLIAQNAIAVHIEHFETDAAL